KVSARECTSGVAAEVAVKPSYGLTDEEIERMLVASYEHAEEDLRPRQRSEAKVEAERILAALQGAMEADAALLPDEERAQIEVQVAALRAAFAAGPPRAIRERTELLDLPTKPFAERRMNRDIGRAIGGHAVGEIEKR